MAQTALAMVLAEPLERIMNAYPHRPLGGTQCGRLRGTVDPEADLDQACVRWCLYVDDIAVNVIGARSAVAEAITSITSEVVESLEQGLKMKVSRREQWASDGAGKTVLAVNDARVKSAVTTSMRRLGIKIQGKASHLGMQFQLGARTRAPTFDQSRWAATVKRRVRARRM